MTQEAVTDNGNSSPGETLPERVTRLEAYETPLWVAGGILRHEILTQTVEDVCCGRGVLGNVAKKAGYSVISSDVYDWGYPGTVIQDFLIRKKKFAPNTTVFINPPFSLAVDFILKSLALGARKIVAFQRFVWWESKGRREFWNQYPPNRIYICGERATCHRFDATDTNGSGFNAHAWFVWEPGNPPGTLVGHLYKEQPDNHQGDNDEHEKPRSRLDAVWGGSFTKDKYGTPTEVSGGHAMRMKSRHQDKLTAIVSVTHLVASNSCSSVVSSSCNQATVT